MYNMKEKKDHLASQLTLVQRKAAMMLVENDILSPKQGRRSLEDMSAELGIERKTLYNWRHHNSAFIEYKNMLADEVFTGLRSEAYASIRRGIHSDNYKAVELYMKREGLLTDVQRVENVENTEHRSNEQLQETLKELDALVPDED